MREGWTKVRLGDVCIIEKTKHKDGELPYVGMEDIVSGTGKFVGSREPKKVGSSTFQFTPEHLLYGRLRPYLNKVMLPDFEGHCSSEIFPLLPKSELDKSFLFYWITSEKVVKEINRTCTGARMPRANVNEVLKFDISIPPIDEQKRILTILDEAFAGIDKAIANSEKNLANARELFESYLDSVLTKKDLGCKNKILEEVVEKDCSLSYGIVQPGKDYDSGLPVVRPTDLKTKEIKIHNLKRINPELASSYSRTTLKGDDLLLCVRGSTGVISVASEELKGANVTRGIVPIRFDPLKIDQNFGYYVLKSVYVQKQIREKTYGAALMQINIRDLKKIDVPFPELDKQQELVEKLDTLNIDTNRLEAIYQQKINSLNELKQSLLQKAFSGELTAEGDALMDEAVA